MAEPETEPTQRKTRPTKGWVKYEPWVLAFACVLPTAVTYAYFNLAEGAPAAVQQAVYAIGKAIQFGLPVVWVGLVLRRPLGFVRWTARGVLLGLAFGVAAGGSGWLVYAYGLRGTDLLATATAPILAKVEGIGIGSPAAFLAVGLFYALGHSLLEEYYWRWFVFRRLRNRAAAPIAVFVSAAGFMAHHVLVLDRYFHTAPIATALLCLAVMIGGAFWAWLYERSGSLLGPWLSHLVIDAAIFAIGYAIVFGG